MTQNQNINLTDELDIQPVSTFNSKVMMEIAIGLILILGLIYILGFNANKNKIEELTELEASQQRLGEKIEKYRQEYFILSGKNSDLKKLPTATNNIVGFHLYLKDLAKFTPSDVWLTEILISNLDNNITIKGNTITPLGVSTLINSLNQSANFRNKKFKKLQLQQDHGSKNINFTISTDHPNTKKEKNPKSGGKK